MAVEFSATWSGVFSKRYMNAPLTRVDLRNMLLR